VLLTPVNVASTLSIIPTKYATLSIYTAKELLVHIVTGYTPLNYTVKNGTRLANYSLVFNYSLNQFHIPLPFTYTPTTILNYNSTYVNYGLFLVRYGSYWGYCSYGSLQYSNGKCYPLNSSIGGC